MTTKKTEKPASKHKSLDIIPPGKVKPSSTSRPIITANQPEQVDNTLTQVPTAPVLAHKALHFKVAGAEDDAKAARGRTVGELISAKHKAEEKADEKTAVEPPTAPEAPGAPDPEPVKVAVKTATPAPTPRPDITPPTAAPAPPTELSPAQATDETVQSDQGGQPEPELYGGKPVIVIHEPHPVRSFFRGLFLFIFVLLVAVVIFNFLLDAGVVSTSYDLPHTNVLEP